MHSKNAVDYRKFFEEMHDAVFILDENLNVVDTNNLVKTWYGYTKEEVQKLSLRDLRAPETRGALADQLQQVIRDNGGTWETVHLRKDGTTFPVEVSCTPLPIGNKQHFYHVVRDISVRKKMEDDLRVTEDRYRQIVDLSPDTIYIFRNGVIQFMNQAGLTMFGATDPAQIIGKSVWSLYPPERHGIVRARCQMMEKTRQTAPLIEHVMVRLDGKLINVEAIARLINYAGEDAFYVIIRDISDRKRTNMFLEMQNAVAKILIENPNYIEAVNDILKIICNNLSYDIGSIWALDTKDKLLHCTGYFERSYDEQSMQSLGYQSTRNPDKGIAASVFAARKPLWFADANREFPEEFGTGDDYRQVLCLPIVSGNAVTGLMEFKSARNHVFEQNVLDALLALSSQIGSYLQSKRVEKELLYISRHHRITNLANREFFKEILEYKLHLAQDNDRPCALILCSILGLTAINEVMEHTAIDLLVKEIAMRLESICGDSEDIGSFRADEFAIMLSNVTNPKKLTDFIANLSAALSEAFVIHNQSVNIAFNFGVAICPNDGLDADSLIRSAAIALTNAKDLGKGAVQYCNPDMVTRAKRRLRMDHAMRDGLLRNEFFLNYQPVIDSGSRIVTGFESLLRWKHDGVIVSPGEFIPIAESSNFIITLGEWVMRAAMQQANIWNSTSDHIIRVAVNVSSMQFSRSDVPNLMASIIKDTGINPECMKIELTESALMGDIQKSIKILTKIKDMGIKISIDDFGTGYSSLNYLRHLPIDYIKIDQSFVKSMLTNEQDATIVHTIAELANNLGYKVIAEGVETQQQLDFLNKIGNFEIQGYFFARPMSADEATEFLKLGKIE
jgi:PAS domain S-box-containing protein/diguanylate cyclase (GGDEF)-like protein